MSLRAVRKIIAGAIGVAYQDFWGEE